MAAARPPPETLRLLSSRVRGCSPCPLKGAAAGQGTARPRRHEGWGWGQGEAVSPWWPSPHHEAGDGDAHPPPAHSARPPVGVASSGGWSGASTPRWGCPRKTVTSVAMRPRRRVPGPAAPRTARSPGPHVSVLPRRKNRGDMGSSSHHPYSTAEHGGHVKAGAVPGLARGSPAFPSSGGMGQQPQPPSCSVTLSGCVLRLGLRVGPGTSLRLEVRPG